MNVTGFLCAVPCKVFLPLKCLLFCHSKRTNINSFYGNIIQDQHKLVNKFGEMYQDPFHPIDLK